MGLSNRERQARYRAKQQALIEANPEVAERALLEEAEQCAQLSDAERIALADKCAGSEGGRMKTRVLCARRTRVLCF